MLKLCLGQYKVTLGKVAKVTWSFTIRESALILQLGLGQDQRTCCKSLVNSR